MNKLAPLFLFLNLLLFSACRELPLDEPTILINKEILAKSKALYNLNRFEQTEDALMNEKGDWVISWQAKNIHNIQNNGEAFQTDQMLLVKKSNWKLIQLDEGLRISQQFSFQGKSYMIGRKNRQSFVLDSLAEPIKLLPAFISSMECSANYCHYNSERGNVFLDKDFNIIWKDSGRNIIRQHPKADHILSYEKNQNYDISYKLINLQTGDSISTPLLDMDNPLSKFRRLIRMYLDQGLDFFPMVINSPEELARYKKMMIEGSGSRERIANDSIKIQLFNWDFEPISPQIYSGRYFTGNLTQYAQYGRLWAGSYSIILLLPDFPILDKIDYAYPIDYKNWISIRDKKNVLTIFYKGQLLKSFPRASIEVLNDQYISVSQNGLTAVYDSTGTKIISENSHQFYGVNKQGDNQEKSVEYIAERSKEHISLINLKTKERYKAFLPEDQKYHHIKHLGADVWTIDNYALLKGDFFLYKAKFDYFEGNRIYFERLTDSLFLAKTKTHYYKKEEQRFTTDDIIQIFNLEGEKVIAGDFFNSFSSFENYKPHRLLKLVPYKAGGDRYGETVYFNDKGEKIWPKHTLSLERAPNIRNREDLARFIQKNDCNLENWTGEAGLVELLEPLKLTSYENWNFYLIHFNEEGYKQAFLYNQIGDELLEGLYWKRFSPFKSGDFILVNAIEMSTGQTKKSVKPIYFKVP